MINRLDTYYYLLIGDGLGNTVFSDNQREFLAKIKSLLEQKYGTFDYKVKFLSICLIKNETSELDVEDKEWLRYILHAETEPNDDHADLLEELKTRLTK
jgi:hypothetical protein